MLDKTDITRRIFLRNTSLAALFGILSGIGIDGELFAEEKSTARKSLAKASPMIPPVPAILLTINGIQEKEYEVSVVWTFVINSHPAQIGISVHDDHVALDLIRKHSQFVLNVPTADMANVFDIIDMNSKKYLDKYELSGLTRGKASSIDAPTIEESPIHVECRTFNEIKVPPTRTLFLAEVVATTVHEYACDDNGRLNVSKVPFFGMTVGSGEFYKMGKKVGHIGQSIDRDDIKY